MPWSLVAFGPQSRCQCSRTMSSLELSSFFVRRSVLLRARVEAVPDITIDELRSWLLSEHKIKVSNTCVWKQLGRLGLTLKKSRNAPRSKIGQMSRKHAPSGAAINLR